MALVGSAAMAVRGYWPVAVDRVGAAMRLRKWVAWKLQCAAARLYDGEWHEELTITTPAGDVHISIIGDEYGCGISSLHAPKGTDEYVVWPDAVRCKEWLES